MFTLDYAFILRIVGKCGLSCMLHKREMYVFHQYKYIYILNKYTVVTVYIYIYI